MEETLPNTRHWQADPCRPIRLSNCAKGEQSFNDGCLFYSHVNKDLNAAQPVIGLSAGHVMTIYRVGASKPLNDSSAQPVIATMSSYHRIDEQNHLRR